MPLSFSKDLSTNTNAFNILTLHLVIASPKGVAISPPPYPPPSRGRERVGDCFVVPLIAGLLAMTNYLLRLYQYILSSILFPTARESCLLIHHLSLSLCRQTHLSRRDRNRILPPEGS
jgi:hypothetical protein